jgi:type IV pilus assembly protein PilX
MEHRHMNSHFSRVAPSRRMPSSRDRGVVIFIALIVMVALSLAAIALIRSVDTTNTVVGNLGFRQASIPPTNLAIEKAAAALFANASRTGAPTIPDTTADLTAENYYASRITAPAEDPRGVPFQLQKKSNYSFPNILLDGAGNEIRYVIERMCLNPGPADLANCDLTGPKQVPGTTIGDASQPPLPRFPFFRVTIRVDGPQNTVSFAQAMLR